MSQNSGQQSQLSSLKRALLAVDKMQCKLEEFEYKKKEPIAIIGLGCRFPGEAADPESFWQLMRDEVNAITEIPSNRWNVGDYYDPDPDKPGKIYTRHGGFIDAVHGFDADFFGISPREASNMDPQQRMMLEVAWEALENAGQAPDSLVETNTGVFIGIMTADYSKLIVKSNEPSLIDAYYSTGNEFSFTSGRISYILGLQGPAIAIDTACSSSLVAIHLACQSLRLQECNLAIAGGVNLILSPELTISLSKFKALSSDGHCKTFDEAADGFSRGEGSGAVVLKRLSDALADRDNILALIRGSAVNHDGPSGGLTVPNGVAQQLMLRQALSNAGVEPSQVNYVEAHGTGTLLGDPIEVNALAAVLGADRSADNPLAIGSVKTNIGHLDSAAGIAGLIKVVLSLQHEEIPAHLHFNKLNPHISVGEIPLTIPTRRIPWSSGTERRLAGVSSFGFSGTNAHVVLEEAPQPEVEEAEVERPQHLLSLSAQSAKALKELAQRYVVDLSRGSSALLGDICFTANTGRSHFEHRLAVVAESSDQLREKLEAFTAGHESAAVLSSQVKGSEPPKVAFLFTGQGSQYVGMGRQLYETQPTFRRVLDQCDELLRSYLEQPLLSVIYPEAGVASLLNETAYTQPALFALEYALAELWRSWGIEPSVVAGHSVGEYVAACVAGVFSLEDGLQLIAERGRLIQGLPRTGGMAAVFAEEARLVEAIEPYAGSVSIAAVNSPTETVISGAREALETVVAALGSEGIESRMLKVSHAFHSPLMEPILDAFERKAREVRYAPLQIGLVSNVMGELVSGAEVSEAGYWRRHVREPVRFLAGLQALHRQGHELFVEVGPQPILSGMGMRCLPQVKWLPSLREGREDWPQMLESLGELYGEGVGVDWSGFDRDYSRRKVVLPTYPFERRKFWISTESQTSSANHKPPFAGYSRHPLLGLRVDLPSSEGILIWQTSLDMKRCSFLLDHCIQGSAILPATAYIEMALAAAVETQPQESCELRDLSFHKPLLLTREARSTLQLWMRKDPDGSFETRIYSRDAPADDPEGSSAAWTLHMTGALTVRGLDKPENEVESFDLSSIRSRCPEEIAGTAFYENQAERGNQWGPCFQGVHTIWRGNGESLSQIQIPHQLQAGLGDYVFHPAVADFCVHILAATLPTDDASQPEGAFVAGGIDEIRVYGSPDGRNLWSHARIRQEVQTADNVLRGDVCILDEAGNLVSEFIGAQLWFLDRQPSVKTTDIRSWIHEISWVPDDKDPGSEQNDLSGQRWVIFSDNGGVGEVLQSYVNACGGTAYRVSQGQEYRRENEFHWRLRPLKPEDFRCFFADICHHCGQTVHKVVHLWNLDVPVPDRLTAEQLLHWQLVGCGSALYVIQAMAGMEQLKAARLYLITSGAQVSPDMTSSLAPAQASLWGLGRTAAIEHGQFWGGLIDLDPMASPESSTIQLVQAMESNGAEDQMIIRDGHRLVARLRPSKISGSDRCSLNIHKDGSYLVTGGLGGIGFETARWLGIKGTRHLILVGRTPLPCRVEWDQTDSESPLGLRIERIRTLESLGMEVTYFCGDISDGQVFGQIRDALTNGEVPPVSGIVHAAGVGQYEPLAGQSAERILEVMQAKVIGGWLLHSSFCDQPIDLFVLFSSISSMLNSPFMGAYAAANTFLDALAAYRRWKGLPALSVSWGVWSETGMAVEGDRVAGARPLLLKGVGTISNQEGLDALELLLRYNPVHSGVMPINWVEWQRAYPAFSSIPFFKDITNSGEFTQVPEHTDDQAAREAATAGDVDSLVDYMTREIAKVLKTTPNRVAVDVSLPALGFDSLMAMEIKNRVEIDLQVVLPVVNLLGGKSIHKLSEFLSEKLMTGRKGAEDRQGTGGGSNMNYPQDGQVWEEGAL